MQRYKNTLWNDITPIIHEIIFLVDFKHKFILSITYSDLIGICYD